jgi:hypothetical protein
MASRRRGSILFLLSLALAAHLGPASAQEYQDTMPAPVCALVAARVLCYPPGTAPPHRATPDDERVIDFTVSADGGWLLYRTDEGAVAITPIYGDQSGAAAVIDSSLPPPAVLERNRTTIAWAPDGLGVAYITADGFRLALPTPSGEARFIDMTDRPYAHLLFSPGGSRLAAQDASGRWAVFSLLSEGGERTGLLRAGTINHSADVAWLDDNSLIVAPVAGGLARMNVAGVSAADLRLETAWSAADRFFIALTSTLDGTVRALQPPPGEVVGLPVSIAGDGSVEAVGSFAIDPRAVWTAGGRLLIYITSGTPILIDPETGYEDALPIQRASSILWARTGYLAASALALDADLYYLAPDDSGIQQVWRLPGDGEAPPVQVTQLPQDALDFVVSPDRQSLALTTGGRLVIVPNRDPAQALASPSPGSRITPSPELFGIAGVPGSRLLATLRVNGGAQPDWRSDGRQITFVDDDGVYLVTVTADTEAPPAVQIAPHPAGARYAHPRFSVDRRHLLLERHSDGGAPTIITLPLLTDTPTLTGTPFDAPLATWGPNGLFSVQSASGGGWAVVAADTNSAAILAESAWPITAFSPAGGSPGAAAQSGLALRRIGWEPGPPVVQLAAVGVTATGQLEPRSAPAILYDGVLSPTGRFAAGFAGSDDGTMNRLIILDLQNGRSVAIRGVRGASALRWVR